ncbi:MAG TPA: hypothetical protein VKK79_09410 [Candidatus Lokiarchaeia archaeon]|nr:hypothetical protein [Candidatus Lokiarchaeia archaeon]
MAVDLIFVMIYEYTVGICGLLMIIPLFKKLRERKSAVTRYLVLCIFFLLAATFFAGTSRVLRITGAWNLPNGYQLELLAFSVVSIACSNVFMLAFTLEVFNEGAFAGKNKGYMLLCSGIAVVYAVYALYFGLFTPNLSQDIWIYLIIFSVVIYIILIRSAFRLSHKLDDSVAKRGMQLIGVGPILLLGTFGSFMLDSIFGDNFTPFYFFGWAFALGFVFITYLGYLQPEWFKRRISHTDAKPAVTPNADFEVE